MNDDFAYQLKHLLSPGDREQIEAIEALDPFQNAIFTLALPVALKTLQDCLRIHLMRAAVASSLALAHDFHATEPALYMLKTIRDLIQDDIVAMEAKAGTSPFNQPETGRGDETDNPS